MSNQYIYNSYQGGYLPLLQNGNLSHNTNNHGMNTSPTFALVAAGGESSAGSSQGLSLLSSFSSNYSFHTPRLRYYLLKLFDIEDDLEFCPDIPENWHHSPPGKKFNAYTASVFLPTLTPEQAVAPVSPVAHTPSSPRVHTPRIKKPLEIVNPQLKLRVASPAVPK